MFRISYCSLNIVDSAFQITNYISTWFVYFGETPTRAGESALYGCPAGLKCQDW